MLQQKLKSIPGSERFELKLMEGDYYLLIFIDVCVELLDRKEK